MRRFLTAARVCAVATLAACSDDINGPSATDDLGTYVAIGTSVSMGWMSEGVVASSQQESWPRKLAAAAGVKFTQPLIDNPGCPTPLAAPLASFRRMDNSSAATAPTACAPLSSGVTLPTNNLAVENATAEEALNATSTTASKGRGAVTSRVLPTGLTQVTAMRRMNPTFVSVEFGGNEVLPAQVGVLAPNLTFVPFATFEAAYSKIIDSVRATGAKALLTLLPTDLRQFPTIRTGQEIASQRAAFAALNVTVNADCDASPNFIFVRGKVLTAVATGAARAAAGAGPFNLSCADVPGTPDYVLTPADVTFINNLLAQMNVLIASKAQQHGYALFSMDALYAQAKSGVPFVLTAFMTSQQPYGPDISLDGVHPSGAGHAILASAAASAINSRYGYNVQITAR